MANLPFINASGRFAFTAEIFAAVDAIRSPGIAKLLRDRLAWANDGFVDVHKGRLKFLDERLRLWAKFIRNTRTSPVNTSYGTFDIADAPSIHAAIDILAPIMASARGEPIHEQKAA